MSDQPARERLLLPILIPVVGLALIATVLLLLSRVLLRVTPTAATITALIVAASILGVGADVAPLSGGSRLRARRGHR